MKNKFNGYQPGLAIIQVGGRQDSNVYIRMKIKAAAEIGIKCVHHALPSTATQMQVIWEFLLLWNREFKTLNLPAVFNLLFFSETLICNSFPWMTIQYDERCEQYFIIKNTYLFVSPRMQ